MKAIVTGAAGLIGSAIIKRLNELGCTDIVAIDILNEKNWKNLNGLEFRDYIQGHDLITDGFLPSLLKYYDTVFHLGACSDTTETNADHLIENNFNFTKFLCQNAVVSDAKFIYASSAATYGDGKEGMSEDTSLFDLKPLNMYAQSKHMFDIFALKNDLLDKITGLKYFNIFGPNESHKKHMASVIYKAFYQIKATGSMDLFKSYDSNYKDGQQKRDFLYVKDAADITIKLADSPNKGLYNIGRGEATSWLELASYIFKAMGVKKNINFIDMPDELKSKYQYFTEANITKLKYSLDFEFTPLQDSINDYINNHLSHDVCI